VPQLDIIRASEEEGAEGWKGIEAQGGIDSRKMASPRKSASLARSENKELACKVLVTGYEFDIVELEREFSAFGKVASISKSSRPVQRAKQSVQTFLGEPDDMVPPLPKGLNMVQYGNSALRHPSTLEFRKKAISASQSLFMSRFNEVDIEILATSSCIIKVPSLPPFSITVAVHLRHHFCPETFSPVHASIHAPIHASMHA